MRVDTKRRKRARKGFKQMYGYQEFAAKMFHIIQAGKQGLDLLHMELGVLLCEALMDIEREEISGPDYAPSEPGVYKWLIKEGLSIVEIKRSECVVPGSEVLMARFIWVHMTN